MNSKQKPIRVGVCIFLIRDGKVVVGKRAMGDRAYPGYYQFPGGLAEKGENPRVAAKRELLEETGIYIAEKRLIHCGTKLITIENDPRKIGSAYNGYRYFVQLMPGEEPVNTEPDKNEMWMWLSIKGLFLSPELHEHFMPNCIEFLRLISLGGK